MSDCCECCVLSGRVPRNELITRPEESYRMWCVIVRDLETSRIFRPGTTLDYSATEFIQGVPGGMCQTSGGCSLC